MMQRLCICIFYIITTGCGTNSSQGNSDSSSALPPINGNSGVTFDDQGHGSLYDSIVPPELLIDTNKISDLLKFTDGINNVEGMVYGDITFDIDNTGDLSLRTIRGSDILRVSLDGFAKELKNELNIIQPAYLKNDPKQKIRSAFSVSIYIDTYAVTFEIDGIGNDLYLKKKFSRPFSLSKS